MEIQYYGGNCLRIASKKASLVVDNNLDQLGLKSITKPGDISLRTNGRVPEHKAQFTVDMPGEYELSGISINGIAAQAHLDGGGKNATVYTIDDGDLRICVLGHIFPNLEEDQLEAIGLVDVLIIPVGGNGYTLDGAGALKLIKKIEPKVVIPTHYADKGVKYEVPQRSLEEALKEMGMEPAETVTKYKPNVLEMTDTTRLVVLERQ